jgi:hypothetical protein
MIVLVVSKSPNTLWYLPWQRKRKCSCAASDSSCQQDMSITLPKIGDYSQSCSKTSSKLPSNASSQMMQNRGLSYMGLISTPLRVQHSPLTLTEPSQHMWPFPQSRSSWDSIFPHHVPRHQFLLHRHGTIPYKSDHSYAKHGWPLPSITLEA